MNCKVRIITSDLLCSKYNVLCTTIAEIWAEYADLVQKYDVRANPSVE
jgi:hypothetical protein